MATLSHNGNQFRVFTDIKHYGVVVTKHGAHIRNYRRDINNGLSLLEAIHKAAVESLCRDLIQGVFRNK
jgi:hypothetical protein